MREEKREVSMEERWFHSKSSKSDKKTFEIISNESVESTMASDIKKNSIKEELQQIYHK